MSIFSRYPYTDFHRLNADWILGKVKEAAEAVAESLGLVRQSAADAAASATAAQQAAEGSVRWDRAQELTTAQQRQAQTNINTVDASVVARLDLAIHDLDTTIAAIQSAGTVRYDQAQQLTRDQQTQARGNIGAASSVEVNNLSVNLEATNIALNNTRGIAQDAMARADIALIYEEQELTTEQQQQVRTNIGALREVDPSVSNLYISEGNQDIQIYSDNPASGPVLLLEGSNQGSSGLDVVVSGVATPRAANDAANKSYADSIRGPHLSTIAGNDVIVQADAASARNNTLYNCTAAELNSLEIQASATPAANRELTIRFTSGATATELNTPVTILGLDDLVPAANTIYEINIMGNLAVWKSWEVSA